MSARVSQEGLLAVEKGAPAARASQAGALAVGKGAPKVRPSQVGVLAVVSFAVPPQFVGSSPSPMTAGAATLAGTGTVPPLVFDGTGALAGGTSVLAGVGAASRDFAGQGALLADPGALAGAGNNYPLPHGTGTLSGSPGALGGAGSFVAPLVPPAPVARGSGGGTWEGLTMDALISDAERIAIMNAVYGAAPKIRAAPTLHLYSNALIPTKDTVIGDFTECTFDGYAEAAALVWHPAMLRVDGLVVSTLASQQFLATGATVTETIYGWYLTDAAGAALWASGALADPVPVTAAGDGCLVSVEIPFTQ